MVFLLLSFSSYFCFLHTVVILLLSLSSYFRFPTYITTLS